MRTKLLEVASFREGTEVRIKGRIESLRKHKNSVFMDLQDDSGQIQLLMERGMYDFEPLRIGDIIEGSGFTIKTQTGQYSVNLISYHSLVKPKKYNRTDADNKKQLLEDRMNLENKISEILTSEGLIRVSTPILQKYSSTSKIYPFTTTHTKEGEFFLRYTMELELKKILAKTQKPIFEIGKVFKNMGESNRRAMESTSCEAYIPYLNFEAGLDLVEKVFYQTAEIFCHHVNKVNRVSIKDILTNHPLKKPEDFSLIKQIYFNDLKGYHDPTFVLNPLPEWTSPLYQMDEDGFVQEGRLVYQGLGTIFQVCQESTDFNQIKVSFCKQKKLLEDSGRRASIDLDFLDAVENGIPPCLGIYIGFDRLLMAFRNEDHIRKVLI